jgi:hypothetical protein
MPPLNLPMNAPTPEQVETDTLAWLDKAVIGLNLCPFAKGPRAKGQIRIVVSPAGDAEALLTQLVEELQHLATVDPEVTDTTLLVHPQVLTDFLDFNDFLDLADRALQQLGLDGVLQIASFHPQFQFAGTAADDITNYTNRTPWPTLHLIREASIDRAVAAFPEAEMIYERNMETLKALGLEGWQQLFADQKEPAK